MPSMDLNQRPVNFMHVKLKLLTFEGDFKNLCRFAGTFVAANKKTLTPALSHPMREQSSRQSERDCSQETRRVFFLSIGWERAGVRVSVFLFISCCTSLQQYAS